MGIVNINTLIPSWKLKSLLINFLEEDIPFGDVSGFAIPNIDVKAEIILKGKGIVTGVPIIAELFHLLNCSVSNVINEGTFIQEPPKSILQINGPAINILQGERLALNILGRLTAISTMTNQLKELINTEFSDSNKKKPVICATRKTTPGFRLFEKYAVIIGGGDTHRFNLSDCVMLKDNHIKLFPSLKEAVIRTKQLSSFTKKIEIEVENENQLDEVLVTDIDIIMLDNFSPEEIKHVLPKINKINPNVKVEISGGINIDNFNEFIIDGVDFISSGSLTHSVKNIDFSMKIIT